MRRRGIMITGVSGAGKTTIAQTLSARDPSFEQVKIVTTRATRPDDPPGLFRYLTPEQFEALERGGELLIRAEYRGKRYGITREHFAEVEGHGKVPMVLVTPESLGEFVQRGGGPDFLTVFIDAPDET